MNPDFFRPKNLQVCARCVCDTSIPSIRFDEVGVCQFCKSHDLLNERFPIGSIDSGTLAELSSKIRHAHSRKRYDCIVGVSGGVDSSYTLHVAKKMGLRPLAVHFDNGWNTNVSVRNIRALTEKLGVDLETFVVNWPEFKRLQVAFLESGVPCIEAPTDVAIHAILFKMARREGVRFILGGQCFREEGTVPKEWSLIDGTYVSSVFKRFGKGAPLKHYPNLSLTQIAYSTFIRGIRQIPVLNYLDYSKAEAKKFLAEEYGWQDYGGFHFENAYSKFAFGWYQFRRFGIDKRKTTMSGPIRSGKVSREAALAEIKNAPQVGDDLLEYCLNKLEVSRDDFDRMLKSEPRIYTDFKTSLDFLKPFKFAVKLAVSAGFFTPVLYEKYFGSDLESRLAQPRSGN